LFSFHCVITSTIETSAKRHISLNNEKRIVKLKRIMVEPNCVGFQTNEGSTRFMETSWQEVLELKRSKLAALFFPVRHKHLTDCHQASKVSDLKVSDMISV